MSIFGTKSVDGHNHLGVGLALSVMVTINSESEQMRSTIPFSPGGKDDALKGSGPRNAVANAGSSETTRQTFSSLASKPLKALMPKMRRCSHPLLAIAFEAVKGFKSDDSEELGQGRLSQKQRR